MSSRVVRRLREEQLMKQQNEVNEDSDDEDEDEIIVPLTPFSYVIDDDDSSESSSDASDNNNKDDSNSVTNKNNNDDDIRIDNKQSTATAKSKSVTKKQNKKQSKELEQDDEDIDTLLSEFIQQDFDTTPAASSLQNQTHGHGVMNSSQSHTLNVRTILLQNIDVREYDVNYSLRNLLHGANIDYENDNDDNDNNDVDNNSRNRRTTRCIFTQPNLNMWGRRPPNFIGGGLSMILLPRQLNATTTTNNTTSSSSSSHDTTLQNHTIPWPYTLPEFQQPQPYLQAWYTFQQSSTYTNKLYEYETYIAHTTGDINTLAMFVADNPFLIQPIFQLSTFFFQSNSHDKGLDLLKRILWILESASLSSFLPHSNNNSSMASVLNLMDYSQPENEIFFHTLFRYIQVSYKLGCVQTCCALSKFLLSIDPFRDPKHILLYLDYYSLATRRNKDVLFVINLVESKSIYLYHYLNDNDSMTCYHKGELIHLPNWSYSYAMALYRASQFTPKANDNDTLYDQLNPTTIDSINLDTTTTNDNANEKDYYNRSKQALIHAILTYPSIPSLLLESNNISINDRSCSIDWSSVVKSLEFISTNTTYTCEININDDDANTTKNSYENNSLLLDSIHHLIKIFIQTSHSLWKDDSILRWLYECCVDAISQYNDKNLQDNMKQNETENNYTNTNTNNNSIQHRQKSISLALSRYLSHNPNDFEDTFRNIFPADANPFNPALIDPVFNIQMNRRRFLQRPRHHAQEQEQQQHRIHHPNNNNNNGLVVLGTGRDGMMVLDPDLPLLELFWRSFMPWARVGVLPGRR